MTDTKGERTERLQACHGCDGPEAASPAEKPDPVGQVPFLQVKDLHKTYHHNGNQINVLRGINFTLQQGEIVSIEGASGVGKSTLIQVLGTLDHPTSGTVLFNGHNVFKLKPADLARFRNESIGFMFQFHHLLPEFTALENVMMPALINRTGRAAAEKAAREMLDAVGLSNRATHKPGELSGGEQQRVALARALVLKPRLVLADEPTGNLDPETGEGIHRVLFNVNRDHNIAVMVVTHSQALARRMPRRMKIVDGILTEHRPPENPAETLNPASSGLPEGSPLSGESHD